jgi:hypothetical protein
MTSFERKKSDLSEKTDRLWGWTYLVVGGGVIEKLPGGRKLFQGISRQGRTFRNSRCFGSIADARMRLLRSGAGLLGDADDGKGWRDKKLAVQCIWLIYRVPGSQYGVIFKVDDI